jgi:hypothetical protein
MKPTIHSLFVIVFTLVLISCKNIVEEPSQITQFEPEEALNKLVGFVELKPNDPLVFDAVHSLISKMDEIYKEKTSNFDKSLSNRLDRINEVGMFQYENGGSALAFSFQNATNEVYVQILNSGRETDFILADYNRYNPIDRNKPSISFRSLYTGEEYLYNTRNPELISDRGSLRGWGKCMKESMDKLFDDWEDEPVATFGCWVFSPLCVIGAGLGCAIKELIE